MRATTVETVQRKSLTNATGYILKVLFRSQDRHQKRENCLRRFSSERLLASTRKTPAKSGKISDHAAKLRSEKPQISTMDPPMTRGLDTHFHASFFAKTASMAALSAQAIALVRSPCSKK